MKKQIAILVMVCMVLLTNAQTYKGKVKDNSGNAVPFVNVMLYSLPDSTFTAGVTTNELGEFLLQSKKAVDGYLEFSFIGYKTTVVSAKADMGTIILHETASELGEITVKAKRPVIRQEAGRIIVGIKGSSLSEAGSLMDVLKRTPGLLVKDGALSVFGKGTPIVFINGREVHNAAEYENLQSDDIASIEIDRNPSARYSASGNAVVRITTKKITKDRLNIQVFNRSYFARKFSNIAGLKMNSKWYKTQFSVNYTNAYWLSKNYDDAYEINTQPDYIINNKNYSISEDKSKRHLLFASFNQELGRKHMLGFQYSYTKWNNNDIIDGRQEITKTNQPVLHRSIQNNSNYHYNLSTYSVNYKFDIDSSSNLQVLADYTTSSSDGDNNIIEKNKTTSSLQKNRIVFSNNYDVYGAKADYENKLFGKLLLRSGVKFSEVENKGANKGIDVLSQSEQYRTSNNTTDRIGAGYLLFTPEFGKWKMEAGVRYEHIDRNITASGTTVLDTAYGGWFPSFSISRPFSDNVNVSFNYNKKISRPSFSQLSSNRNYIDSLSYSTGNPELKASIIHSAAINIALWRKLFIQLSYNYNTNDKIVSGVSDAVNPDIVAYRPVNIDKSEYWRASVNYELNYGFWNSSWSFDVEKPICEVPYLGKIKKMDKIGWNFQCNNDFKLAKWLTFYCNFIYSSPWEDLMTYYDKSYDLTMGINTSFFHKRLKVSLMMSDILNSSETAWKDQYGNVESYSDQDKDRTYLRLSVKYNFNKYKDGIRKKSASSEEQERM